MGPEVGQGRLSGGGGFNLGWESRMVGAKKKAQAMDSNPTALPRSKGFRQVTPPLKLASSSVK